MSGCVDTSRLGSGVASAQPVFCRLPPGAATNHTIAGETRGEMALSLEDQALYDRQIRLWGLAAQQK